MEGGDQEIMICKGVVKDNVVLLEAGAQLPDGAEVRSGSWSAR